MLTREAFAWAFTVGSRVFRGGPVRLGDPRLIAEDPDVRPQIWRGKLEVVTMEVGSGDAKILVAVYADGRTRLGFGTGQEFTGCCQDLPLKVGAAAREILEAATPLIHRLPREVPENLRGLGSVSFTLRTPQAVHSAKSKIADLEQGRSALAPLWESFSTLLTAMIVTLFGTRAVRSDPEDDIPGLTRARRIWGTGPTPPE